MRGGAHVCVYKRIVRRRQTTKRWRDSCARVRVRACVRAYVCLHSHTSARACMCVSERARAYVCLHTHTK